MFLTATSKDLEGSSLQSVAVHCIRIPTVLCSLLLALLSPIVTAGQRATLTDDAQTAANAANQNFGSRVSVQISGTTFRGFFKFKLTPNLPTGTTGAQIEKATLKLYLSAVNTPGNLEVYRVSGAWDEASITQNTAPPIGSLLTSVSVDATQQDRWITIDVTSMVKDWLDGVHVNNGVALVAAPTGLNVVFNSKENQTTSHEAILEISLNHIATADQATNAVNAANAMIASTANALANSATINGNQVNGDLANATIAGNRVTSAVANAVNADAAKGVVSAAQDSDIISPTGGQIYFNTTSHVFRQYDGTTWKTIDADLANRLSSAGTLNAPSNPVDWTQLKNVPSNAAAGYSAGNGINIDGSNVISSTGVLSVSANGPLNSSGGQNPNVSLSGVVPIANGGTGSSTQNFVDLSSNQTIAGNKTFSNAVNTNTQYNIGGLRILHNTGASNLFAGIAAGNVNTGSNNAFFGFNAGSANTTGSLNAFFGQGAGQANTTGQINAFFGSAAGTNNSTGVRNSFVGALAGTFNTAGGFNSFFGTQSGFSNTTGVRNSFLGNQSGQANTTGSSNVLVGDNAGFNNTTGAGNTFVGQNSGASNTTENQNTFIGVQANGAAGISNATAVGANAMVTTSNTMVLGTNAVTVQVPGNLNVNGTFTGSIPAGSGNYIQNTTTQQAASNFNISGDGTVGGTVSANFLNAATEYRLGGQRVLSTAGASNMFVGVAAGNANATGSGNSFFGAFAGEANTTGDGNSFFGNLAGRSNTSGSTNSFFGWTSGLSNTSGTANSFFGFNTGNANTTGGENAFFGNRTGEANTTGGGNSFFGSVAGKSNTTGFSNSFFGQQAGNGNTSGNNNSFFGESAGQANTIGNNNAFFGNSAGAANTTARFNSIFGTFAGLSNSTGEHNSFFGFQAGRNSTGDNNSFFGSGAGQSNGSGTFNAFFGGIAGVNNSTGSGNAFYGQGAGSANTTGNANTFVGQNAGTSNTTESSNTFIGAQANGAAGISNATAIGANATVNTSDTMVLGTNVVTVQVPGNLNVSGTFTGSVPAGSSNYIQNTMAQQASSNFNISGNGTAAGTLSANNINADTEYTIGGSSAFSTTLGNTRVGLAAGNGTIGTYNIFVGLEAGRSNSAGSNNAFLGRQAGKDNNGGNQNSFVGTQAGISNVSGNNNTFVGFGVAANNLTGSNNTMVGSGAGQSNTTENNNTFIGFASNGAPGITNATAIGSGAQVTTSDTMVLGTNAITVQVPGNLSVANSFSANGANLTNLNASNVTTGTLDNARLGVVPVTNGGTGSSTQNFVDLSTIQTVSGNKSFTNNVNVGNSTTGGSVVATNTVNRFLELGSNVSFDSVSGTVVGIRLKATNPAENYSYGIFHGSNVYPGALVFRKDDESISPGDLRNRLIIAGNGDVLVNPGSVGIGTQTPTQKLEVNNGNLRLFRNDGGRPAFIMNLSGAAWTQIIQPDSRLDFVPAEGPGPAVLTLNPSGNVGIGTTAPGNLLHLSSAAGAPGIQIDNTTSAKSFSLLNVAGSNPRLSLNDVTAGTERLVVESTGNVGIGTTTPTQKLEVNGNLRIDGDFVATGTKSAVVILSDNREVALYAVESTGNWFEDFGSAKLNNGVASVQLDSLFAQTVNTNTTYHVFLTPNGNCNGLYVAIKTATGFEVRELTGGRSNITFDYRIVARRKGYENVTSQKR